jgi:hypothetical protein
MERFIVQSDLPPSEYDDVTAIRPPETNTCTPRLNLLRLKAKG